MSEESTHDREDGGEDPGGRGDGAPRKRRSPRHVKAAARILQKEGRKILRKHQKRLPPAAAEAIRACVAAIDTHRNREDWHKLEDEAEVLDELLHQHASFARKSALRETLENIGIAIGVAVALRSCFYEPFKIPSGSMMPTLRTGDHIFVNKYRYGVQIPFTTTVVGEDVLDTIHAGDVVVFRYPLDESEDFIKRVIGLPGDVVRVEGRDIWIQRAGESEFSRVERTPTDDKCMDEAGVREVEHCRIFEEHMGDRSYRVRYLTDVDPRAEPAARTFAVPEGQLLVMGDNRNLSHDSLAWTASVEAVSADRILTVKDLRDLTTETLFTITRPRGDENNEDPSMDSVLYLADHRAPDQDLELQVWRDPSLGPKAVFEGIAAGLREPERTDVATLLERGKDLQPRLAEQAAELGAGIDALAISAREDHYEVVWMLEPSKAVFRMRCGKADCRNEAFVAQRLTDVIAAFHEDHSAGARELIEGEKSVRYSQHWRARDDAKDRFIDLAWSNPNGKGASNELRLRAWRGPDEGTEVVRSAALAALGSNKETAQAQAELGEDAWLVEDENRFSVVIADAPNTMVAMLECGKARCADAATALELGKLVRDKLPAASKDRRRMRELLGQKDVGEWPEKPTLTPKLYEWDRVSLDGTTRGGAHMLSLRVRHKPERGLEATAAEWRNALERPEEAAVLGDNAWHSDGPGGHRFVFIVPQTESVLALHCGGGLCPDRETADALAKRAAEKALDANNFIDPEAERSRPYVPRGNVKGRAERIWLPFSRFWLPVR